MNIIKINMNVVVFLISIAISCWCIEINLPLDPQFRDLFATDEVHMNYPFASDVFGVTCYDRFYEAIGNNIISRVLYNGFELFYDPEKRDPPFRRIVSYSHIEGRTYITIYQQSDIHAYEGAFYIVNLHVYNLLKIKQLISGEEYLICNRTPGRFVSKMFRWLPSQVILEDQPSTSAAAATSTPYMHVKRRLIELDIDNIFERRLIGRYGIYSSRKKEKSKRSKLKKQLKLYRHKSDSDSD